MTAGVTAAAYPADVADRASVAAAAERITADHGRVDILVNNAGTCIHRPALEVTEDEWRTVLDVNLTGVWNGCQVFGAAMVAAGRGVIVNVGSMSGEIVNRPQWQPAYNASKAAVHHLTRSLAAEWAPHGVRVNAVAPGYVRTDMSPDRRPALPRPVGRRHPDAARGRPGRDRAGRALPRQSRVVVHDRAVVVADGGYTVF